MRIGVSARLLYQVPQELGFRNKNLQYIEQSLAHWIMEHGAVAFMVPAVAHDSKHAARHLKVDHVVQELRASLSEVEKQIDQYFRNPAQRELLFPDKHIQTLDDLPKLLSTVLGESGRVLFYAGMAFAYYVVFPLMFQFLASTTPTGVKMMTDIASYLDFVLLLFMAFGIAFEMPVAVVLLVVTGLVKIESLTSNRGYVILGIFIIAAFLTPRLTQRTPGISTITRSVLPRPKVSGVYISSARAGGTMNSPGVVARATYV